MPRRATSCRTLKTRGRPRGAGRAGRTAEGGRPRCEAASGRQPRTQRPTSTLAEPRQHPPRPIHRPRDRWTGRSSRDRAGRSPERCSGRRPVCPPTRSEPSCDRTSTRIRAGAQGDQGMAAWSLNLPHCRSVRRRGTHRSQRWCLRRLLVHSAAIGWTAFPDLKANSGSSESRSKWNVRWAAVSRSGRYSSDSFLIQSRRDRRWRRRDPIPGCGADSPEMLTDLNHHGVDLVPIEGGTPRFASAITKNLTVLHIHSDLMACCGTLRPPEFSRRRPFGYLLTKLNGQTVDHTD